jgi:hypothetical protein
MTVSREEFLADLGMASDEIAGESDKMANSSTEDASAASSDESAYLDMREAIDELLIYVGTVVIAEKGIRDKRPVLDRCYLAGRGKVAFVFDVGAVVLDLPNDVLPELQRAAEAVLAYLEGQAHE